MLDLACGTGDPAYAIAQRFPGVRVIGIDAAERMLDIAERRRMRRSPRGISFVNGDMRCDNTTASKRSSSRYSNPPPDVA